MAVQHYEVPYPSRRSDPSPVRGWPFQNRKCVWISCNIIIDERISSYLLEWRRIRFSFVWWCEKWGLFDAFSRYGVKILGAWSLGWFQPLAAPLSRWFLLHPKEGYKPVGTVSISSFSPELLHFEFVQICEFWPRKSRNTDCRILYNFSTADLWILRN